MTKLEKIPTEIIRFIVSHLTTQDTVANLAITSRQWHPVAMEQLYCAPRLKSRKNLICFADRLHSDTGKLIISLDFSNPDIAMHLNRSILESILQHSSSLEQLNLTICKNITAASFQTVLRQTKGTIKQLILKNCKSITREGESLYVIAEKCPHLQHLNLSGIKERHNISRDALNKLAHDCPELETLILNWCIDWVDDRLLMEDIVQFSNLKRLELEACRAVTDEGVLALVDAFPGLEILVLGGVLDLTERSILPLINTCAHLHVLDLSACKNVTPAVLDAIELRLMELRTLDLRLCPGVDRENVRTKLGKRVRNLLIYEDEVLGELNE